MNVIVKPGACMIQGGIKLIDANRTLSVQASDPTYDRIDTVVMRLNDNRAVRDIDLYVRKGTPAVSPTRPELTQTESLWEIGLADLFITKNTSAISQQRITDTRLDISRCGVVSSIATFDTTGLYDQIQNDLNAFKTVNEADFDAWFQTLQNILDENTAGHLQNEIGTLSNLQTAVKTSLVAAVNELKTSLNDIDTTANEALPYNNSRTYEVGEYCSHNKGLYKCSTAIATAEPWNAGHWETVKIGEEIKEINSSLGIDVGIQDGKPVWKERGADTWNPFSTSPKPLSCSVNSQGKNWIPTYGVEQMSIQSYQGCNMGVYGTDAIGSNNIVLFGTIISPNRKPDIKYYNVAGHDYLYVASNIGYGGDIQIGYI